MDNKKVFKAIVSDNGTIMREAVVRAETVQLAIQYLTEQFPECRVESIFETKWIVI